MGRRPEEGAHGDKVSYQAGYAPPARPAAVHDRRPRAAAVSLARGALDLQELTERLRRDCPWDREQTARDDRPAHGRGGLRGRGRGARRRRREAARRARRPALPGLLPRAAARGARRGRPRARSRAAVHEKLVRRHPHVFGDVEARTAGRVRENWEQIKREQEGREGIFHDVPETLPALLYARKVQRRAAAVGFEYPDVAGRARRPRRRARASCEAELARRRAGARDASPTRASPTSSATCSSRRSTSRGG